MQKPTHIGALTTEVTAKLTTIPSSPAKSEAWAPQFDAYEPSLLSAKATLARFVADMGSGAVQPYWITLTGVNGTGKTMLMKQVFDQADRLNPGNPKNNPIWPPDFATNGRRRYEGGERPYVMWLDERMLAQRMRSGQEWDLAARYRGDFFVAFDELGSVRDPTNFISDALATFCESRLRGWTMFTTNLSLKEIAERIDARVASRLIRDGNTVVQITARDYALTGRAG